MALVSILPAVTSCSKGPVVVKEDSPNTSEVTYAEAEKETPSTIAPSKFVPPPRTIHDVMTAITRSNRGDLRKLSGARSRLEESVPQEGKSRTLARLFLRRADAAHELGRLRQEIENVRLVVKYNGEQSTLSSRKIEAIFRLGVLNVQGEQHTQGLDLIRKAIDLQGKKELELVWSTVLARMAAGTGDLMAGEEAMRRAEDLFSESASWKWATQRTRLNWKANLLAARGSLLDLKGQPGDAEPILREAVSLYRTFLKRTNSSKHGDKGAARKLREFYGLRLQNFRRQGKFVEAEVEARKILLDALRTEGRISSDVAFAVQGLIQVLFDQGRYSDAEKLARANVQIFQKIDPSFLSFRAAKARAELADALAAQGRWHEALSHYEALRKALESDPVTYERLLAGNLSLAMSLMVVERYPQALGVLKVAHERSVRLRGEDHFETALIQGAVASAYAKVGERQRANLEFGRAVPVLVRQADEAAEGGESLSVRGPWLDLVMETFIHFLAGVFRTPLDRGGGKEVAEEAFRLTNLVRNLGLQSSIRLAAEAAAEKDPELAQYAQKQRSAHRQIVALTDLLAEATRIPAEQQNPFVVESLRSKIAHLRSAQERLNRQIERRFPAYAQLTHPHPTTVRQARSSLRPGESLISIYMGQERIYIWAIRRRGRVVFSAKAPGRWQIEPAVAQLRRGLHPESPSIEEIPRFNLELAYELYRTLLSPVRSGWRKSKRLFIVGHGELGRLPFAALPIKPVRETSEEGPLFSAYKKVPWLVRQAEITMLPSVASLKSLRSQKRGVVRRRPFIGFGDPLFDGTRSARAEGPGAQGHPKDTGNSHALVWRTSYRDGDINSLRLTELAHLPGAEKDVRGIAVAMRADPSRDVYLGEKASEETLKSMDLSNRRVVYFATHGLLPGDLNGLTQPALALSKPAVPGEGADGLLTMEEVLGLRLNADWVVLPAFGTSHGGQSGSEALAALERAFLYAGARTLLVNNWPVETSSAHLLMTDLFRRQRKFPRHPRADLLRQAMLALMDKKGYVDPATGKTVFSYAHPIFWAPFCMIGDGGGATRAFARK